MLLNIRAGRHPPLGSCQGHREGPPEAKLEQQVAPGPGAPSGLGALTQPRGQLCRRPGPGRRPGCTLPSDVPGAGGAHPHLRKGDHQVPSEAGPRKKKPTPPGALSLVTPTFRSHKPTSRKM